MKVKGNILIALLLLMMTVILSVGISAADGDVCYIDEDTETLYTLNDAINTAQAGSTIHLTANAALDNTTGNKRAVINNKALTIDGTNGENKFTITFNAECQVINSAANAKFTNVKLNLNSKHFRVDSSATLVFGTGTLVTGGSGVNGGAVQVNNTSELVLEEGSTITDCHADTSNGGAIFVNGGTVTVNSGARIENCTTSGGGGAIHVQGAAGKLNLLGGEITGNTSNNGGGIYMYEGTLTLSGDAVVTGNKKGETDNNIQLRNASQLTLTGTFTGSAGIFINPATVGTVFGIAGEGVSCEGKLLCDSNAQLEGIIDEGQLVFGKPGAAYIGDDKYNRMTLNDAINTAQAESTIHLTANAALYNTTGNERAVINNKALTIDGANGEDKFTITFNAECQVINSAANAKFTNVKLNLNSKHFRVDSSATLVFGTGTLVTNTAGYSGNGGAVEVGSGTELVLESGSTITTCTVTGTGGAIFVNGGTVTVNPGATIENCTAAGGAGGGIQVQGNGTLNLLGGTITGNTGNNGGGIYMVSGSTLTLSGDAKVTGNKRSGDNQPRNIKLDGASQLTLTGEYTGSAGVFINPTTAGTVFGIAGEGASGAENLFYDGNNTSTQLYGFIDGTNLVFLKSGVAYIGDYKYNRMTLDEAIRAANGSIIHLIKDASLGGGSQITYSVPFSIDGTGDTGEENYKITFIGNIQIMNIDGEAKFTNVTLDFQKNYSLRVTVTAKPTKLTFGEGAVAINGSRTNGGTVEAFKNHDSALDVVLESGSVIKDSVATSNGGAIFVNGGTVTVNSGARIENCTASSNGGAIHVQNQSAYPGSAVINGTLIGNTAGGTGGAIHIESGTVTVNSGASIKNCTATGNGGAIFVGRSGTLDLLGGELTGNTGADGGGIHMHNANAKITISGDAVVTGNKKTDGTTTRNIRLQDASQLTLTGTFTGSLGLCLYDNDKKAWTNSGDTFGVALADTKVQKYDSITNDMYGNVIGLPKDGALIWATVPVMTIQSDCGVYTENEATKGIVRFYTEFTKADSAVTNYGTYVINSGVFDNTLPDDNRNVLEMNKNVGDIEAGKGYIVDVWTDNTAATYTAISFVRLTGVIDPIFSSTYSKNFTDAKTLSDAALAEYSKEGYYDAVKTN